MIMRNKAYVYIEFFYLYFKNSLALLVVNIIKFKNMRKLPFFFCLAAVLLSCQSWASVKAEEPADHIKKLTGVWLREGDASAGDVIKIEHIEEQNVTVGVLTKVSNHSKMFGYQPGDIKWKLIRINEDGTILINNLNSTITREEASGRIISTVKTYGPFLITVRDENLISLQNKDTADDHRIGNEQKWRRISK